MTTSTSAEVTTGRPVADVLDDAVRALTEAARVSGDWAEFVTHALAGAAANVGSVERALAGRPGSWEADGVRSLLNSTVGCDDEYLFEHRTEPVRVVLFVDELLADRDVGQTYDQAQQELAQRPAATEAELDAIADVEERLDEQRRRDWQEYGDALKAAVESAAAVVRGLRVPVSVVVDIETFRPYDDRSGDTLAERLLADGVLATALPAAWARPPLERLEATS